MTRTEALRRLEGTWIHELRDGRVRVRDVELLRTIDAIRREDEREAPRPHPLHGTTPALVG